MKTKVLLNIAIIAIIPAMLSMLLLSIISFEWLFNDTGTYAEMFLTGKFNRSFTMILFSTGLFSMAIILASQLALTRYSGKIDRLDEAEIQAWEAKRKYEEATRKLLRSIE
jgi:hypothetical protein